jgi:nucleotide-binding universal stress UspA family protein
MLEKVLIPTDFSKYADKVIECVAEIPGIKEVVLLNVKVRDPLARVWSPGDENKEAIEKMEMPKMALEGMGLKVKTRVEPSENRQEASAIDRAAEEENVSMVVMGARGKSFLGSHFLGSVTTDYLQNGTRNLLIMRYKTIGSEDKAQLEKHCHLMFSKVLCPTDFSPAGNAAIDLIKATKLTDNVVLLHVVAKGETMEEVEARVLDAKKKLEDIKTELTKAGINTTALVLTGEADKPRTYGTGGLASVEPTHVVSVGGAVEKISSVADGEDVSIIAMGSHGKGWLDQATIGSVVSDVARMGNRPVLIVRSEKKA